MTTIVLVICIVNPLIWLILQLHCLLIYKIWTKKLPVTRSELQLTKMVCITDKITVHLVEMTTETA